jgi:hypothetical protein
MQDPDLGLKLSEKSDLDTNKSFRIHNTVSGIVLFSTVPAGQPQFRNPHNQLTKPSNPPQAQGLARELILPITVRRDIKADLLLASISGGTDIIACFMGENSVLPVHKGEIQSAHLGCSIQVVIPSYLNRSFCLY